MSFENWLSTRHSAATRRAYCYKVRALLAHLDGAAVTNPAVLAWLDTLQQRGIRPRTLTVHLAAIRAYAEYLEVTTGSGIPGLEAIRRPRLDAAVRAVPDTASVHHLLASVETLPVARPPDTCTRSRARIVLYLLAYSGLRRAELLDLNVADIQHGPVGRLHVRQGKGRISRWIPLGDALRDELDRWLTVRDEWCRHRKHQSDALFPARSNTRLTATGFEALWKLCMEAAGFADRGWTPHCLRHWFASQVGASHGAKVAQILLGHASVATTHGYLHADDAALLDAVAQLGQAPPQALASEESREGTKSARRRKRPSTGHGRRPRPNTVSVPMTAGRRLRITVEIV